MATQRSRDAFFKRIVDEDKVSAKEQLEALRQIQKPPRSFLERIVRRGDPVSVSKLAEEMLHTRTPKPQESLRAVGPIEYEFDGLIDGWWAEILSLEEREKIAGFLHRMPAEADEWGFAWISGLLAAGTLDPERLGLPDDIPSRLQPHRQKFSDRMSLSQRLYDEHPELFPGSREVSDGDLFAWMQKVQRLIGGRLSDAEITTKETRNHEQTT